MSSTADITIVLTSSNRPNYIEQTLTSIAAKDLTAVEKVIVIEDSSNSEIKQIITNCLGDIPFLFLKNSHTLGQIASIDRAYSHVTTPFIFHCEDDWIFPSSLFLDESRQILNARCDIHSVMLRDWSEAPSNQNQTKSVQIAGIACRVSDPKAHRRWGSLSFNPGLRRT